ncbi:MAG: glycoside hydrolase [Proteobacteria bacterium]|nr:glycoside hydrolase [Pseudomonadota bacterium]
MQTVRALICLLCFSPLVISCDAFAVDSVTPLTVALKWRMIGPYRGGRTRAVAGVPSAPNIFYIGAVDGGVWKTDDAGRTWQPIFDDQPSQSVGAIAVAPSDPNRIYVGSGEGLHRPDLSVGDGIYRSDDAGRTWSHLGLRDGQQIPDLAVDPGNPDRVFAAVLGHPYGANPERGIYRSLDGGKSWQKVLGKDNDTGGSAVAIDPSHPNIVYAALWQDRLGPWEDKNQFQGTGGGLFKSTDGGDTWQHLTTGLPENTTQVNFSIAASTPERLFAVVGTNEPGAYSSAAGLGVFRTEDGGRNWTRITSDPRPALRIGGGDLPVIRVDPSNPDVVYSTGLVTMKSVDGGITWSSLRGAPGGDDYQNLWINPKHSDTLALVADQGAVITVNGGKTWSSWFNQPTAQLYHVSVSPTFPYRVCAGQQESGSVCISSRGNDGSVTDRDWHPVGVIEYGYVAPDPLDPNVIYGAGRNVVSRFFVPTGQVQDITPIPVRNSSIRVTRTEPLLFSPADPRKLFYAANQVYRTQDGGQHWDIISPDLTRDKPGIPLSVGTQHGPNMDTQRGSIYALSVAQHDQFIWAGTDDGLVWRTADGGKNWSDVTPPELTAWSKVAQIDASHFDDSTAYIAVNRMRVDDLRPYAFKTHDGGKTWQSIAEGLPADEPVNSVREDTQRKGLLFAATEKSIWVSVDDGAHWASLQLNLPHTSMRDLWIHDNDLIVGTHGRSIWILDDISILRQLGCCQPPREVELIQPSTAYRVEQSTWTDTPIQPDEPLGRNPPAGAIIDYVLPANIKGPVELEIRDAQQQRVVRFTSNDPLKPSAEERARELIPAYWLAEPVSLPSIPGAHRWIWNLHYPAPDTTTRGYPISAVPHATTREPQGPLALPGEYMVRLTAGGRTVEKPLLIKADPRVKVSDGALTEQFQLASRLSTLLSESSRAVLTAQSERAQLEALAGDAPKDRVIADFRQRLVALLEPMSEAQEHVDTLYKMVVKGDAAPTAAQTTASNAAEAKLTPLFTTWKQLQTELPALNKALRAAHLGKIRADLPAPRDQNVADEE